MGLEGLSWSSSDDLRLSMSAVMDLLELLLLLLLLLLLELALVALGEVRGAQHDEGVQAGHGGGAHYRRWRRWWRWWRWVLWSRPEVEQLVVRLRLVRVEGGEEMLVVLHSAVTEAVAVGVNCIDHSRPRDLPRFPRVLSRQETLQEENLGGEEGCEGPLRPPVTSSWSDRLVTL